MGKIDRIKSNGTKSFMSRSDLVVHLGNGIKAVLSRRPKITAESATNSCQLVMDLSVNDR